MNLNWDVLNYTCTTPLSCAGSTFTLGVVPESKGGFGMDASATAKGSIPAFTADGDVAMVAPNTTTTKKFLCETGNGTIGAMPTWCPGSDVALGSGAIDDLAMFDNALCPANEGPMSTGSGWTCEPLGGYVEVQDEASAVLRRSKVNFTGAGVSCVDNSGSARTDCTITAGSAVAFDATNNGVDESTGITHLECDGNGLACGEIPDPNGAQIKLDIGTASTQVAAGNHTHQMYSTVKDETTSLTQRSTVAFLGAGVSCADNGGQTECTISGGGGSGYDTIQDEGSGVTQRTTLNFAGAGVSCADDTTKTTCTITGTAGGDAVSVNGIAASDADLDDATPAAAGGVNVKWQKDSGTPNNVSAYLPTMVASGGSHAGGAVPDTPASSGTTKFLREDATWAVPAGGGGTVKNFISMTTDASATSGTQQASMWGEVQLTNFGAVGNFFPYAGTLKNMMCYRWDSALTSTQQTVVNITGTGGIDGSLTCTMTSSSTCPTLGAGDSSAGWCCEDVTNTNTVTTGRRGVYQFVHTNTPSSSKYSCVVQYDPS